MKANEKELSVRKWVIAVSIAVPLVVAVLLGIREPIGNLDTTFLPPIYAAMNGLTAICLVAAVMAIKKGKRKLHENLIKLCMAFSLLFLLMYVVYHVTTGHTVYGGEGISKGIYFFILITHIALSIGILPIVLFTYVKAWSGNFESHKKWAKIAFPLWLYVAVTGVIVYLMLRPYY